MLGKKQRYGSQITHTQHGEPLVLPLEDRSKVEQYRREIGILSFSAYLQICSKQCGGKAVKYADDMVKALGF